MAVGRLTDYAIRRVLEQLIVPQIWVGLAYENPTGSISSLAEVTGPGYARKAVTWIPTVRSLTSANVLSWIDLPAVSVVTWVVGFNAETAGDAVFSVPLSEPGYFESTGVTLTIPVGGLVVGLDAMIEP